MVIAFSLWLKVAALVRMLFTTEKRDLPSAKVYNLGKDPWKSIYANKKL